MSETASPDEQTPAPVEEQTPDVLEEAKQNLDSARQDHAEATQKVLDDANEFYRPPKQQSEEETEDKLLKAAREAQMQGTKKWYQFWQTATKIPKDNKYEVFGSDEKITWKNIVKGNDQMLRDLVSEKGVDGVTWKKMSSKSGVTMYNSPEKSAEGKLKAKMYKLETQMNLAPKSVLLGVIRGPVLGVMDENLTYFREHYNFVGGKTSLVHHIRTIASSGSVAKRDFFDLTNWSEDEDGTIYFTSSSVKAFPTQMPEIVRGATLFQGLCIKPTETGGSDLTFISQVYMGGWVPNMVLDWYVPSNLVSFLKSIERSVKKVVEDGNEEKYVKKFVLREIDVE